MFESRNICDLGLLQNARTHGPRGTVKSIFYIGPKPTTFVVEIPTRILKEFKRLVPKKFKNESLRLGILKACFQHFDLEMCFAPQRRAPFRHLSFQTWSESEHGLFVLYILTSKRASCHNGVHLFDIATSQSAPMLRCFVHFDFEIKCTSRHHGVHFFDIATSRSAPMLRCFAHFDLEMCFAPQRRATFHLSSDHMALHWRFSEPTFRPSGATNHGKNTVLRDFPALEKHNVSRLSYLFARLDLLSSDTFSFLIFFLLLFSSLLFSDSSHLCFSSVHMVGSLTSKLPSINTKKFTRSDNELNVKNSIL